MRLAREIVALYHSKEEAKLAEERFIMVFAKGSVPKDIPTLIWKDSDDLMTFLVRGEMVKSKSEVRRLINQNGIKINDKIINSLEVKSLKSKDIIKIGKKRFIKIL
jgi:tyrosyl-tRNA synthetase